MAIRELLFFISSPCARTNDSFFEAKRLARQKLTSFLHLQRGVRLQQTQDAAAGNKSFDLTVARYRQLISVFPVHDFDRFRYGSVWRYGGQLIQRAHRLIDSRVGPARAIRSNYFI